MILCVISDMFATSKRGSTEIRFGAMGLPSFHAMGLISHIYVPLSTGQDVAVFRPQHPALPIMPSPSSVLETAMATECQVLVAPPSFIEVGTLQTSNGLDGTKQYLQAWSSSSESLDFLKSLHALVCDQFQGYTCPI